MGYYVSPQKGMVLSCFGQKLVPILSNLIPNRAWFLHSYFELGMLLT